MKIFWTTEAFEAHNDKMRHEGRTTERAWFTPDVYTHNTALYVMKAFVAWRDIGWWKKTIAAADKAGDKYMSLAKMIVEYKEENEKRK